MRSFRAAQLIVAVVAAAFVLPAQLAHAAPVPGSLSQLPSPNACIQQTNGSLCSSHAAGINGTVGVAVTPDGRNAYVVGITSQAVAELARAADGSLSQLASPNDCVSSSANSGCATTTIKGLIFPEAVAVSPDGKNVYVAAEDSNGIGTIVEFARNPDGTLQQLAAPNDCVAENPAQYPNGPPPSDCSTQTAHGIHFPTALAVSPDGKNLYVIDGDHSTITEFARDANGALTQPGDPANHCIAEHDTGFGDCNHSGNGLQFANKLAVSPDGTSVYATTNPGDTIGDIAEFARGANGSLTQLPSPNDCIDTNAAPGECGTHAVGLTDLMGIAISPDGENVYSSSGDPSGPLGEFARHADGSLSQLGGANNCIEEHGGTAGCGSQTGHGLGPGGEVEASPDGADVYVAASCANCDGSSVAEFARNPDGTLTQLASPDDCIQEQSVGSTDCGNETGRGFGGAGIAVSPGGESVYVTGISDVAELARTPVLHTVMVSITGPGMVSDGTGAISCPSTCSHTYTAGTLVTLAPAASPGSAFTGWSGGGCSGTGPCQIRLTADTTVAGGFTGGPSPLVTGSPLATSSSSAAFSGSVNPDGLPTTAYFQYGLDSRYTTPGTSGPIYDHSTPPQTVGSDFSVHPVSASVSGLVPNALYHVRLVAINSQGTSLGQDATFTTPRGPAPGPPALGKTFNISLVNGVVLIKIHGVFIPLTELQQIPKNTVIDALHGTLTLTTALPGGGGARDAAAKGKKKVKTQSGTFSGAIFKIAQATRGAGKGLATLALVEAAFKGAPTYATCKTHKATDATAAALSSKTLQLLHANAKGKFRTSGRYSAATVRGTKWTIADRCDGTLTHDITHSVAVTDFVRHKTIILHARQSYLAKAHK